MTELPRQLERQAAEIERFDKELEARITAQTTQPSEPEPASTPNAEAVVPTPAAPAETPKVSEPKTEDPTWQQRFLTLQGKYNAEVPRLNAQIKELTNQLTAANARIDALSEVKVPEPKSANPLVTEKDVETFGSDLIDLVKRQAQEIVTQRERDLATSLKKLETENADLRKQLTGVSERQGANDQQMYLGELRKLVPDFEAVNVDEGFLGWLAEVDPLSGLQRQAYLDNAFQNLDVQRTAAMFSAWKQLSGRAQQPAPVKAEPQISPEVQRQVAPGKSKSSSAPAANPSDRIWSASEIDRFYRDAAAGQFKGTADELARIEAEIDLALAEGRVRG